MLRNRLRFYENPHAPPSQPTLKRKKQRDEKIQRKRGAPKGHKGATRKRREPDEVIHLSEELAGLIKKERLIPPRSDA